MMTHVLTQSHSLASKCGALVWLQFSLCDQMALGGNLSTFMSLFGPLCCPSTPYSKNMEDMCRIKSTWRETVV
ncbi:hypothetical protein E2C01_049673 [Portunus trituberculatus]|uniref:Uncharacterized protein n=1 Tax=Portunus trituberculatus TaxID=210409 RepID=A0A5B7G688_PORTR|nr:hypothetical protein [Portunus trituberculatus]